MCSDELSEATRLETAPSWCRHGRKPARKSEECKEAVKVERLSAGKKSDEIQARISVPEGLGTARLPSKLCVKEVGEFEERERCAEGERGSLGDCICECVYIVE